MGRTIEPERTKSLAAGKLPVATPAERQPSPARIKVGVCHKEPDLSVRGNCSTTFGAAAMAAAQLKKRSSSDSVAVPKGTVMLYPPTTLPALVCSSWFVPKVKRPWKGVPTFAISIGIQCGLFAYLIFSVYENWDEVSACDTAAFAQLCSVYVFATSMFNDHSNLTELQICLYSTVVQTDGYNEEDALVRRCTLAALGQAPLVTPRISRRAAA